MSTPSIVMAQKYTDRDLIQSILNSYYIVDYGYINRVNGDKTVNVTHAKLLKTLEGKTLPETITTDVEVLTISSSAFSISIDYKAGDKVILLGLKDYVKDTKDVTRATETRVYSHYSRANLKALPLSAFNADAKVSVEIKDGTLKMACSKFQITNSSGTVALEVTP